MGSGTSSSKTKTPNPTSVYDRKAPNTAGQKTENNDEEGNKFEDKETDSHKDDDRLHVNEKESEVSSDTKGRESTQNNKEEEELKKRQEEDFLKKQEQIRLERIGKLKSNVKHQMSNIVKCKEDNMSSHHQVTNMTQRLQQFCIGNGLVELGELKINPRLTNVLAEKRKEKTKLLHKLSEIAGTRLKHNNPNLADLSDENRPTKLVDRLSELYDNDWTDIFEKVREKTSQSVDDKVITCNLRDILKTCYEECKLMSEEQRQHLRQRLTKSSTDVDPTLLLQINNLQKKTAEYSMIALNKKTKETLSASKIDPTCKVLKASDPVYIKYVEGCTDIMWHTQIQNPPLVLEFESTNKEWYKKFTSPGQIVDYIVWPAVFLYENGPLLGKGIAQFVNADSDSNSREVTNENQTQLSKQGSVFGVQLADNTKSFNNNGTNIRQAAEHQNRETMYEFSEAQRYKHVEAERNKDADPDVNRPKRNNISRNKPIPVDTNVPRVHKPTNRTHNKPK